MRKPTSLDDIESGAVTWGVLLHDDRARPRLVVGGELREVDDHLETAPGPVAARCGGEALGDDEPVATSALGYGCSIRMLGRTFSKSSDTSRAPAPIRSGEPAGGFSTVHPQ
jgi:hypothetical protein